VMMNKVVYINCITTGNCNPELSKLTVTVCRY